MSSPVIDEILQKARDLFASAPAPPKPATATTLGGVKLRGDLAGPADAPTVPALEQKASLGPDGKVLATQLPDGTGGGGGPVDWTDADLSQMPFQIRDPATGEPIEGDPISVDDFLNMMYATVTTLYMSMVTIEDNSHKYRPLWPWLYRLDDLSQLSSGYRTDTMYFAVADDGTVTWKVPSMHPKEEQP